MNVLSKELRSNAVFGANFAYPGTREVTFQEKDLSLTFVWVREGDKVLYFRIRAAKLFIGNTGLR